MNNQASRITTLAATVVACSAAFGDYEYRYFDQVRPLVLDTNRVALLANPDLRDGDEAALARLGIDTAAVRPWARNWRLAPTPARSRSDEGVPRVLDALVATTAGFVSPVFFDALGGPLIVSQDILVRFRSDVAPAVAEEILNASVAGRIVERDWAGMRGAYRVRASARNGLTVLAAANALAARADVQFAEPDFLFTGRKAGAPPPDDELFPEQWGLHNLGGDIGAPCSFQDIVPGCDIDAPEAWEITAGDPSVVIVVIDDGVELDHADLQLDPAFGMDFTGQGSGGWPVNRCDNHGTLVAGSAGALWNDLGIVGVAPQCQLAIAKVMDSVVPPDQDPCDGMFVVSSGATPEALAWAEQIGARVTNNSNIYGHQGSPYAAKYEQTHADGMVHFAAPGNAGAPIINCPACLDSVNAIANVGPLCGRNATSNYGDGLAFAAPGSIIVTTDRTGNAGLAPGNHACINGTSVAAPHAAGVAALVLSVDPSLTATQVEWIMRVSATDLGDPGYDIEYGWGLVNAARAVKRAQCPADIDGDGAVGVLDLLAVLGSWGPCGAECPADMDGSGAVDVADLLLVLGVWGPCV